LTADKYAKWLATAKGEVINIFPDYETFGEHHWPETGIHSFLTHLPDELLKYDHLRMVTPTEVVDKHASAGEIDVPEAEGTVSWADAQRDQTGWLGNVMQWAYFTTLRRLEPLVREAGDETFLRLWRDFQISDHLYYMFTAGGGPGEVHSYFSHYESPQDAFVAAQMLLNDFETRIRLAVLSANEPFLFYTDAGEKHFTGTMAWSLKGFIKTLQEVDVAAVEFHAGNGDFESWAEHSLKDKQLAQKIHVLKASKQKGERLRRALVAVVKRHFTAQSKHVLEATGLF
jgi:alpha-amylase